MNETPTVVGKARPVRRFLLLAGSFALVIATAIVCWPLVRVANHIARAQRALDRGNTFGALRSLEIAEKVQPDHVDVQYSLAVANRRAGRLDRFEVHLERASQLGRPEEDIQRQRWLATAQAGNVQAVERQLMDTIDCGASDEAAEEIYEALAKGHLATYRLRDAWKCLDFWLRWRPDSPRALLLRAGIYERLGEASLAAEDCRAAVRKVPEHHDARIKLGQVLLKARGGVEEAREHFQACLETAPHDSDANLGLAQCERRLGHDSEAFRHLQTALAQELTPNQRATALAEKGELLLADGRAGEAVEVLADAAELAPAEVAIHFALSRALSAAGQPDRARHHADILRTIKAAEDRMTKITNRVIGSPDDADLRCEAGSILVELGLKHDSVGWLVSALRCDPAHRKAHQLLGEYCDETSNQKLAAQLHLFKGTGFLREGRLRDALEEFGHARDHRDTAAYAYALSGEALYKAGQFGDAVHILNRALQLDPSQTDARRWLAATYHDIGAMEHAIQHLQVVADQAPVDPRPHRLMGLIRKDFEAYREAIAAYRETLRRDPDQPDLHSIRMELAECQIELREHAEALKVLGECPKSAQKFALQAKCHYAQRNAPSARKLVSQALELQPDHLDAMQLAATMDLEAGDVESSVRILRQAVEYHPREFRVRYRLAQAYGRLGERDLAEEQMRQMQELRELRRRFTDLHEEAIKNPANVEIRYQLGMLADQLGKPELARTWYAAVIGMAPDHIGAQKGLRDDGK